MAGRKLRMSDFEETLNEEGRIFFLKCPSIFLTCILSTPVLLGGIYNIETLKYYHDDLFQPKAATSLGFGTWVRKNWPDNFKSSYSTWVNAHA